eukprot:TRINITY_DN33889_c0_g1_i1.p1 TRINITY_DN33889_c0_g1~~TRINITY_DN33889_c0_g1_i1.p1  ORF type:complete len:1567 (-),score=249.67 TRINITY_DN33889_c0_g1_i1:238-4938(-)
MADGCTCSGWLRRRVPVAGHGWRNVWCMLKGSTCTCYMTEEADDEVARFIVSARTRAIAFKAPNAPGECAQLRNRRPHGFAVVVDDSKRSNLWEILYFEAEHADELQRWLAAFQQAASLVATHEADRQKKLPRSQSPKNPPTVTSTPSSSPTMLHAAKADAVRASGEKHAELRKTVTRQLEAIGHCRKENAHLLHQTREYELRRIRLLENNAHKQYQACTATWSNQSEFSFTTNPEFVDSSSDEEAELVSEKLDMDLPATPDEVAEDLTQRGTSLGQLLEFVEDQKLADRVGLKTREVVRDIILPLTRSQCCALADIMRGCRAYCDHMKSVVKIPPGRKRPSVVVSHYWEDDFMNLVYSLTEFFASKRSVNKDDFSASELRKTFWVSAFAQNHHRAFCGSADYPCSCGTRKALRSTSHSETDKFELVVQRVDEHVLVVDAHFQVIRRMSILAELYEAMLHRRHCTLIGQLEEAVVRKPHVAVSMRDAEDDEACMKKGILGRIEASVGVNHCNSQLNVKIHSELEQHRFFLLAKRGAWDQVRAMAAKDSRLVETRNRTDYNTTVLHVLCGGSIDDADTVKHLISLQADPTARENMLLRTPAHLAAQGGLLDTCIALASSKCDMGLRSMTGHTALDYAIHGASLCDLHEEPGQIIRRRRCLRLAGMFIDRPWLPADDGKLHSPFFRAAWRGDAALLTQMLDDDPNLIHARDRHYGGFTALHFVCERSGSPALIVYLVNKKADVAARSRGGESTEVGTGLWTPLHCAAFHGHREAVEALISLKASALNKDTSGRTPKDMALARGFGDTAALLASWEDLEANAKASSETAQAGKAKSLTKKLQRHLADIKSSSKVVSNLRRSSFRGMYVEQAAHEGQGEAENLIVITDPGQDNDFELMVLQLSELTRQGEVTILAMVTNMKPAVRRAALLRGTLDMVGLQNVPVGIGKDQGKDVPDTFSVYVCENKTGVDYFTKNLEEAQAVVDEEVGNARYSDGQELLKNVLRRAADKSVTVLVLSACTDIEELASNEEPLFLAKVKKVVCVGGVQATKQAQSGDDRFQQLRRVRDHRRLLPDMTARTNQNDPEAAQSFYQRCQELGVDLIVLGRFAAYRIMVPRATYDLMIRCPVPNPVVCRMYFAQLTNIEDLWQKVHQGGQLPARCDRKWFCNTFLEGQGMDRGPNDQIWDLVQRFIVYAPLALLAVFPETYKRYFKPERFLNADGRSSVQVLGLSDEVPGVMQDAVDECQGYLLSMWMRAAGRPQQFSVERPRALKEMTLTASLSPMKKHSPEFIDMLSHSVHGLLNTEWPSLKNSSLLGTWRDRDRLMRNIGPAMMLVPWQTIESLGRIPHSCEHRTITLEQGATIASSLGARFFIEMCSHRWASPYAPDFRENSKARALVEWAKYRWSCGLGTFFWIDYACIDQSDIVPGVIMLPLYVSSCNAIVCFDSPEYEGRGWCRAERVLFASFVAPNLEVISHNFRFIGAADQQPHTEGKVLVTNPREGVLSYNSDLATIGELVEICEAHWSQCWKDGLMKVCEDRTKLKGVKQLRFGETQLRVRTFNVHEARWQGAD